MKKPPKNIITKKDLKSYRSGCYLTVGQLKKFVYDNNISDDAIVLLERVEDSYFDGSDISGCSGCKDTENGIFPPGSKANGWSVYLKNGEQYYYGIEWNQKVDSDYYLDNEEYHNFNTNMLVKYTEEELEMMKDQYHIAFCCTIEEDNKDILFIKAHY